jgi:hypothetical protein
VTLDDKYKTKSDGGGYFMLSVKNYKPFTCMRNGAAGDDIHSAVIAGCLDPGDVDGPLPSKTAAAPASQAAKNDAGRRGGRH